MTNADLDNRFTYHAPKEDHRDKYMQIRIAAKHFASLINDLCPEGREKSLAITHVEEAVFWANAAIAREPQPERTVAQ